MLAGALVPLNSTMIALALSPIAHSFHVSVGGATWLVSAYLVAMAVVQPLGGRLGDLIGHRRAFLAGVAGFALFSAAAAVAQDFPFLVALRVAQALAGGTMGPNAAALLRTATDSENRGRAFGWFGTGMGLAAAVGPPLGGLLVGTVGWRTIFVVNLPLAAIAFFVALWAIERDAPRERRPRFDTPGAAGDDGTAFSPVRGSESLRVTAVLHTARLGVEGQSERSVRQLAPERLVRLIRGVQPLMSRHAAIGAGATAPRAERGRNNKRREIQ